MAVKGRKPIPKTQREISNSLITPYDKENGNPNLANPNLDNEVNRSQQISFRGDTTKPFSVSIQDIDEAVFYYLREVIKSFVIQNGVRIPVPVIYGAPEKWKSFQKDGYYRDLNGEIMAPLIMFKRTGINKNRSIANKLDANLPYNYGVFTKGYNSKNAYDNFNVLNNRTPNKVYYSVVVPDYVTVNYQFAIFTYYVEQQNKIVEAIEYASDSYWGNPERFKFKAMIDSFGFQTELSDSNERVVRSTFDLSLNGYIIPDVIQKDMNAQKKSYEASKIIFSVEATNNEGIFLGVEQDGCLVTPTVGEKETQNRSTSIG